jgi:hypothetical protein
MEPDKDRMDKLLSEALKNYSAVEPRLGLETRVLARLQAEREKSPSGAGWWWVAVATAAAALAMVGFLIVRPARVSIVSIPVEVMKRIPTTRGTTPPVEAHETHKAKPTRVGRAHTGDITPRREGGQKREAEQREATLPKLDQFPSPRPLSEQERRLAGYVAEHRDHAVLVARAQTALSKLLLKTNGAMERSLEDSNP